MTVQQGNNEKIQKRPEKLQRIVDIAWQLLESERSKAREQWNDTEYFRYSRKLREFVDAVLAVPEYSRSLSEGDILEILQSGRSGGKPLLEATKQELYSYLDNSLTRLQKYYFCFPLEELFGLPNSYALGACKVADLAHLPEKVRRHIVESWDFDFERRKGLYFTKNLAEYKSSKEKVSYLCLEIEAGGRDKAIELAARIANQGLNIYKCLYHTEIPPLKECKFWVDGIVGGVEERREHYSFHSHHPSDELERYVKLASRMVLDETGGDEVSEHVVSAIDVYGLVHQETPIELKFILSVFALEGLLAGKDDKDFVGWKLREKVALLLGGFAFWIRDYLHREIDEPVTIEEVEKYRVEARRKLARMISDMYELRSLFAHASGELKEKITEGDYRFASMIFRLTLQVMLHLYEVEGIRYISKQEDGDKSLDWLLESLKFSQPLPFEES